MRLAASGGICTTDFRHVLCEIRQSIMVGIDHCLKQVVPRWPVKLVYG